MNHEQMREALQAIETVLGDAYDRRFAECCGRGQTECCGDFNVQWTPEDHKILNTLSPIQRKLSKALATEPKPLVRLTEKWLEQYAVEEQFLLFCDMDEFKQIAHAIMDAMEAKNKG